MIDRLTPLSFSQLMRWIVNEQKKSGSIFGVRDFYQANPLKTLSIFNEKIETPFGPASGPHTQFAQSIIAAYASGCRFFELKTVSLSTDEDLKNPRIRAKYEGYNVEGAKNLSIEQAFEEYVKAWVALKVLSKEFQMGGSDGFVFNMCIGYDYDSISSPEITRFLNNMKDASKTDIYNDCVDYVRNNLSLFRNFTEDDLADITPNISSSVTIATHIVCSREEVEKMARYCLINRKLHTYVKLSATLLGYEYCRSTLNTMGYCDVMLGKEHFDSYFQYSDAQTIIENMQKIAAEEDLIFGIKLISGLPVVEHDDTLEQIYMSGKAIFPLATALAAKLSDDFGGQLRMTFSGGVDANNVEDVYEAGMWPITMSTTILKPGGFNRFKQFAYTFHDWRYADFDCTRTGMIKRMSEKVKQNSHFIKPMKPNTMVRAKMPIPLIDCFISPCKQGCPIEQDITTYLNLIDEERYADALRVIISKNPLPFVTGTICTHECMSSCTRNFYDKPVKIREAKLIAAQNGYDYVLKELTPCEPVGNKLKVAVVGGGPAGMSAAYFLARAGHEVTIYCDTPTTGGIVKFLIPEFRMPSERVNMDAAFLGKLGVNIKPDTHINNIDELKDYDKVILTLGAPVYKNIQIPGIEVIPALEFLKEYKATKGKPNVGNNIVVIGCGDTALDTARAARRIKGVENVYIVYRRTRRYMPASEDELLLAMSEGVQFMDMLMPYEYSEGFLKCHVTKMGDMDSEGRRIPIETSQIVHIKADCVIAAVGEAVDTDFYRINNIEVDDKGLPVVNEDTLETNIPNVFIAGDGRRGPLSVVDAIADARKVSDAILKEFEDLVIYKKSEDFNSGKRIDSRNASDNRLSGLYSKKGILREPHYRNDFGRCLDCAKLCENCVDVCPNRANVEIKVPGNPVPQVIHVDRLCNECGNCKTFCPYVGAPYQEKFTLFDTLDDFYSSDNEGCVFTHDGSAFTIRLDGQIKSVSRIEAAEFNGINMKLCNLIATIYQDYRYLIY